MRTELIIRVEASVKIQNFESLEGNLSFNAKFSKNFNSDHKCSVVCVHMNFCDFASCNNGKLKGFRNGKYLS